MGWNEGYTIYESIVVGLYDLGKLDRESLAVVMKPFKGTDMDHGGKMGLSSYDDLSADEIVLKIDRPEYWAKHVESEIAFFNKYKISSFEEIYDKYPYGERGNIIDEYESEVSVSEEWHDWFRQL